MDISVQCIVGANGSGKSTLLEILYAIINNLACKLFQSIWAKKHHPQLGFSLSAAKGFEAELFYETDGNLHSIRNLNNGDVEQFFFDNDIKKKNKAGNKRNQTDVIRARLKDFFYTISNNYSIYSLNYAGQESYSLLDTKQLHNSEDWIRGIFDKVDGYLTPLVINPYRDDERGAINIRNEILLAKQRLAVLSILFFSQEKKFMDGYIPKRIEYKINLKAKEKYDSEFYTLARNGLPKMIRERLLSPIELSDNHIFNYIEGMVGEMKDLFCEEWRKVLSVNNYKIMRYDEATQNIVLSYLSYKTLKIAIRYPSYGEKILSSINYIHINEDTIKDSVRNVWGQIMDNIPDLVLQVASTDTQSHITQKIQQCLSFIQRGYYKTTHTFSGEEEFFNTIVVGMDTFIKDNLKIDNKTVYSTYDEVFFILPPSFFEWVIFYKKESENREDTTEVTLDGMSSGEKQDLISSSYLMYHLTNLQSVIDDTFRISYHHVNLVFDEVELYFHPEFQRTYLTKLITMLSYCHIDTEKIKSINIIIVTHSPFVLSDVILEKTLYLTDGKAKKRTEETFAAHIHNLLVNQFFIEKPMGEVAAKAIEEIAAKDNQIKVEDYDYYRFVTKHVGDRYIQNTLLGILNRYSSIASLQQELVVLKKRQSEIENQINALANG